MREALSRRERQILDVLFRCGEATVAQVVAEMTDPPGYDAVRTTLRILERKNYVRHWHDGPRYLYAPVASVETARASELKRLVRTFFGGSPTRAALALLSDGDLNDEELERIRTLLETSEESP